MAALTWREVSAPSFYTSLDGFRTFGNLLDNAGRAGIGALDGIERAQTQNANNAAMLESLKYSDPAQYQQALAAGNITGAAADPSKISAATLGVLAGRTGALTDTAKGLADFNYQQDGRARLDNASAAISDYLQANAAGNLKGASEALTRVQGLRPDQFVNLVQNGGNFAQTGIGNQRDGFSLGRDQQNYADQQVAQKVVQDIQDRYQGADALGELARQRGNMSPGAYAAAQAALGGGGTGGAAGGGTPAAGMIAGAVGGSGGNAYNTTFGNGKYVQAGDLTSMSLGQVEDLGNKQIDATKGKIGKGDLGTSALGAYQMINDTRAAAAKALYGDNWKNVPYSPQVQEQLAEYIFNQNKGGDLTQQWEGLKGVPGANKPGAFKDKSWAEVRNIIASRESSPLDVRSAALDVRNNAAFRQGENNATPMGDAMVKYGNSTKPAPQVAKEMVDAGMFGDAKPSVITDAINQAIQAARANGQKLNPEQAGYAVVANSLRDQDRNWWQRTMPSYLGGASPGNWGTQYELDPNALANNVRSATSLSAVDQVNVNGSMALQSQLRELAQTRYDQALAQYQQAQLDKAGGKPNLDLAPFQARLQAADAALRQSTQQGQQDPTMRPAFNPVPGQAPATPLQVGMPTPVARTAGPARDYGVGKASPNDAPPALNNKSQTAQQKAWEEYQNSQRRPAAANRDLAIFG